jgi:Uma2 family endonuclease
MATVASKLTVAEFEKQYGGEKPYYEYWYGEAVQKSMPNSCHGQLQSIIAEFFKRAGYKAGSEIKLKIDPDFQPIPDVIADRSPFEFPYPTKALEVVVEILSDDDVMSRVLAKCRTYDAWGFEQIYVVDPANRLVFRWHDHRLEEVGTLAELPAQEIWSALDRELG